MSSAGSPVPDQLQGLLDAAIDAVIIIDHHGRIETFNRAAQQLFGFELKEILGQNVNVLMSEPDRSRHDEYLARYLETGVPHIIGIGREIDAQRRDGTVFAASLAVGRVMGAEPPRFVGFLKDISEERRIQEESRRTQERLTHVARLATMGEMAAGIAHELNQPLAAITNYAQACERLLRRPDADIEEVRGALGQIAAQALRAGEIIRRLRSLVRKQDTSRVRIPVNTLITELSALTTSDAQLHDVRLVFDPAPDLPEVFADPVQIQQVLLNLVRNAIEAVAEVPREQRQVRLQTGISPQGDLEIAVSDTGPGVDPRIVDRLFDPFCTTKPSGTGLGLAISRSIVHAHKGTLRYEPQGPGARFVLQLPRAPALPSGPEVQGASPVPGASPVEAASPGQGATAATRGS